MEALLKKCRQLSSVTGSKVELLKYLTIQEGSLKINSDSLLYFVNHLTLPDHSLPILFGLSARFETLNTLNPTHWGEWINIGINFCSHFNVEDVKLDLVRLYKLCYLMSIYSVAISSSPASLNPLLYVLTNVVRLTSDPQELTPLHAEIVKLALMTKRPHLAVPLISQKYLKVNRQATGLAASHVILFFYYGGSIWLSLKHFDKAVEYFIACISTPSIAIHAASVEAFKKLILVKLISQGVNASIPRFASGVLQRFLRQLVDVYNDLASVYTREDPQALKAFIDQNAAQFKADKNYGLIKQLIQARTRRLVQQLTNSYMTVSLADIAQQSATDPRAVELILRQMIEDGNLDARIDQENGIVIFEEVSASGQYEEFEHQSGQLLKLLKNADQRLKDLMLDPDYVRQSLLMKDAGIGSSGMSFDLP